MKLLLTLLVAVMLGACVVESKKAPSSCDMFCMTNYRNAPKLGECYTYCRREMEAPKCDCGKWLRWGKDIISVCHAACGWKHGHAETEFSGSQNAKTMTMELEIAAKKVFPTESGQNQADLTALVTKFSEHLQPGGMVPGCDAQHMWKASDMYGKVASFICGFASAMPFDQ